jgi:hypothetical protein
MAAIHIDQVQLQADGDVILTWVEEQMTSPLNVLLPEPIKIIIERWIPIYKSLLDSDHLRNEVVKWINSHQGS